MGETKWEGLLAVLQSLSAPAWAVGLVGLALLAAVVYRLLALPQRVHLHYRWPGTVQVKWQPWPGQLDFSGQVEILRTFVTGSGLKLKLAATGAFQLPGPWSWRLQREVETDIPWRPGPSGNAGETRQPQGFLGLGHREPKGRTQTFRIDSLRWRTTVGAGDAARTALLAAVLWQGKGVVTGFLATTPYGWREKPVLVVEPRFNDWAFTTVLDCILLVTVRDIIYAARGGAPGPRSRLPKE